VALAAAGALVLTNARDNTGEQADDVSANLTTVKVQQRDITTYDETTATLQFRTSSTISSPVAGTVTSTMKEGDVIDAGTVVATIDGEPVVALVGDVPGWRQLASGVASGIDVRQLEQNLVALGYDTGGATTIDQTFTSATTKAVTAWEDSLGLDGDGKVPVSQVVFIPGRILVDSVKVGVGSAATAGSPLITGRLIERRFLVSAGADRTLSAFAAPGTAATTGTVLYRADGLPVAAIEGDPSAVPALSRDLAVGVSEGADVRLLEQMLVAGEFDAGNPLKVDDTFDLATAGAVLAWWKSVDPAIVADPATLVVRAGSFVVVPAGLRMGTALVPDGARPAHDTVALTLSAPARVVTTSAPIDDETFALGAKIDVEFPDGTVEPGTVVKVGTVATTPSGPAGQTPTVTIDIQVESIPTSVDEFVSVPVTLRVVADSAPNALVVPVSALVALAEGGYALEVADGTTADGSAITHLVKADAGLFADGFVVVTGNDIHAGLDVVVPS
ncbi:MAG TPA: peptidoglycan-binding domain-containing protein, partial [Acidimicrobiales bacterium]